MASTGKLSHPHQHNDGTPGWDINVQNEKGDTVHKAHVTNQTGVSDEEGKSILSTFVDAIASVFDDTKKKD